MSDRETVRAVYDRNGSSGSGDNRFELNREEGDVEVHVVPRDDGDDWEIPYLPLPDGTNVPLNQRIFRPDGRNDESRYVLEVGAGDVTVAEASTEAGATAAATDPITQMAMAGDRGALEAYYASKIPGIGEKKAKDLAEDAINRVQ